MSEERRLSEEMQSAFVDGQLEADDWAKIAARLDAEPGLREDVCRLRALKDMVRHAYEVPPPPPARSWRTAGWGWKSLVAAAIVFALLGWFGRAEWDRAPGLDAASAYALSGDWHALRGNWRAADGAKVLVHVSTGGHEALGNALDEVEDLLHEAGASHRRIQVEIVANGGGLDLLRASDPDFPQRLEDAAPRKPGPEAHRLRPDPGAAPGERQAPGARAGDGRRALRTAAGRGAPSRRLDLRAGLRGDPAARPAYPGRPGLLPCADLCSGSPAPPRVVTEPRRERIGI